MSRSTLVCFIVGTLLCMVVATPACRGCRTEPPTAAPAVTPDPSGKPPNIKMDHPKAVESLREGFATKPGDCKPGTGPSAIHKRPDGALDYPPCEPTEQLQKRLEELEKRGRAK